MKSSCAAVATAWAPLAPRRRVLRPRLFAVLLASLAVAVIVVATAYLPPQARFAIGAPYQQSGFSWVFTDFLSSAVSPSPAAGLYVSLVGAAVAWVGAFLMTPARRERRE